MALETTTRDLLLNLSRILKEEKADRLRSVEDIRIGVVRTPPQFPVIAIIPINRRISGATNGILDVLHTIRFDVYTKKLEAQAAFNQGVGIINTLKTILLPSYTEVGYQVRKDIEEGGEATVASTEVVDERFTDVVDYNNSIVHYSLATIEFFSHWTTYQSQLVIERASTLKETPPKELMEVLFEMLKEFKESELTNVESFKYGSLPPQAQYPCVYVTTDAVTPIRSLTSAEIDEHEIKIITLTKLLDNQESLLTNMGIAEKIFDILNANSYLGGRVIDYSQPSIDFGQMDQGDTMLYSSTLNLNLRSLNTYK
jgi:hypothetical protein